MEHIAEMSYASSIRSLFLIATCASFSSCAWYSSVREKPGDQVKEEATEQVADGEELDLIEDPLLVPPVSSEVEAGQLIAPPPVNVRNLTGIKFADPDVTSTLPSDSDAQPKFNSGADDKKDSVILAVPQTSPE